MAATRASGRHFIQDERGHFIVNSFTPRAQVSTETDQDNFVTSYVYDPVGRTISRQFPTGDLTSYGYDAIGRTLTTVYADGTCVTLQYDPVGNRISMSDSTGQTTYTYDPVNRPLGKTDPGSLSQYSIYDAAGQRVNLVDPDNGVRTYTWDIDSRLQVYTDTGANRTTMTYDAASRKTSAVYASGLQRQWTYDAASQIVSIIDQNSSGARNLSIRVRQVVIGVARLAGRNARLSPLRRRSTDHCRGSGLRISLGLRALAAPPPGIAFLLCSCEHHFS
jgi:YD repeat-containing protein